MSQRFWLWSTRKYLEEVYYLTCWLIVQRSYYMCLDHAVFIPVKQLIKYIWTRSQLISCNCVLGHFGCWYYSERFLDNYNECWMNFWIRYPENFCLWRRTICAIIWKSSLHLLISFKTVRISIACLICFRCLSLSYWISTRWILILSEKFIMDIQTCG